MEIQETADLWVVRKSKHLRIPDIKQVAAEYTVLIDRLILEAGLEIGGPWIFISRNLPKDSKTSFDWQICRPVNAAGAGADRLELVHLEPIMVASRMHHGSLRTLFTKGYAPLVAEMDMSRYIFSGESREIYHGWNGPGAAYHAIEIQFGLAR